MMPGDAEFEQQVRQRLPFPRGYESTPHACRHLVTQASTPHASFEDTSGVRSPWMRFAVERLQGIFDSLDYQVAIFDREWRYIYLNHEAARNAGRPLEELLGRSFLDVFPGSSGQDYYWRALHQATESGQPIHRDHYDANAARWLEHHFYPIPDGVLVLVRDVTPERQATEALRQRETMLRLAQQSGGIATFEWDFDRKVAHCSAEFFRMLGLPAIEGEMQSEDFGRYVHPLDRSRMASHLERTIAGLEPATLDYRIVTADGRTRWLSYSGQLHRTPADASRMLGAVVDITERKTAEEELRLRDERHRAFVATSTEAIWRFEVSPPVPTSLPVEAQVDAFFDRAFLAECNETMARMYGFETPGELVGTRLADMMPASDPVNREYLRAFAASGYRLTGHESREKDRHGRLKFFRNSLVGIVEDDAITRAWGTQTDITEQKQAEAQLRESEARFRLMADNAPVLIWLADTANRGTFFNRPWLQFTGGTLDEQLGTGWIRAIHPDDRETAATTCQQHFDRRESFSMEFRMRRHDGAYRWVLDHGTPLVDGAGAFQGYIGACVDITDVKAAQERASLLAAAGKALALSLDYRQTLQRVASSAVPHMADWCVIDMCREDGTLERVAVAHREPAAMPHLTELAARQPRLQGPLADAVGTRRAVLVRQVDEATLRQVAQDERHLDLLQALAPRSAIVAPVVSRERVLGAISLVLSDSGRSYDAQDVGAVEDLAYRVAMAIDNARLYEEAQAANRAKDDFLARLSHELRTPLNAVLGWALMLRGVGEPARLDRGLDVIDRNARALSRIIEDLLDFSRNVRGGLRIDLVPTDLRDVARQAIMSVAPLAVPREIVIRLTAAGPATVKGDPARLQQVVWNLLTNAIKFTPAGGSIVVNLECTPEWVRLVVRDTGSGIRPELMSTIFDPFRQGDAHGTPGLGLGLAIVRQIVEAHGGTVEARNAVDGPGAIFVVSLPPET